MSAEILGLSLTQPWATLVAVGAKKIETRSWQRHWRGCVAIHAARAYPDAARDFAENDPWPALALERGDYGPLRELPRGAIIAVARLVDVQSTGRDERRVAPWVGELSEQEQAFGDFGPRRFGWFLEDVQALANPIPCRGALGLWPITDDVLARIDAQIRVPR